MRNHLCILITLPLLLFSNKGFAQKDSLPSSLGVFEQAPSFHKGRFWGLTAAGVVGYSAVTVGLDRAWYANYPRSRFHFFDDWNGWRQMDKFGHAMTGYFESKWAGQLYQWTGVPQRESAWIGFGTGLLFQTTLEMLDGFSDRWGFSWGDMAFNVTGSGLYLGQELLWKEQRILLKMSAHRPNYSRTPLVSTNGMAMTTLSDRAANLFGTNPAELLFKEYNGQTIWLSVNLASFMKERLNDFPPPWLNIAVGYGIQNVYGAEQNSWTDKDGNYFVAPADQYPRYSQFYLSLDVDFERIPTKHKWLKTVFGILNIFKIPFPALEVNTLGEVKFHPFYF